MSGEFGNHGSSYFHEQIRHAADDATNGGFEITKLWGRVLTDIEPIARAISWAEAGDSGGEYPIIETIKRLERVKADLFVIERYVELYKEVAEAAVREKLEERKEK